MPTKLRNAVVWSYGKKEGPDKSEHSHSLTGYLLFCSVRYSLVSTAFTLFHPARKKCWNNVESTLNRRYFYIICKTENRNLGYFEGHVMTVSLGHSSFQIHAYSNINENFQIKRKSDILHIFAQNIDCGYPLEQPRWGSSNEYPQSMCFSKISKLMYTPVNPSFTI